MVAELFNQVKNGLVGFFQALGGAFSGVTSIVWETSENGVGSPTFLGALLIISATIGMGYMSFRLIKRLVSLRG